MSDNVHLRVIGQGSLGLDGHRRRPYPADVKGRFVRARRVVYAVLIALWAALPWIPVNGHPAVFLDIERRQFFLFGMTFNAQDAWLLFFALSGIGFGLVYATALLGRVWCGWACPQSVFLEAVFRPIERLINGPRNVALRRARDGQWNFDRIWRAVATHAAYLLAALLVAHVFIAYFVSIPRVFAMVRTSPGAHPEAFGWMLAATGIMYGNFAFFHEQLCVVICPYGRLQSVLLDDDSMIVGYDEKRGEPRGHSLAKGELKGAIDGPAGGASAADVGTGDANERPGDCVDCNRCVVVCPTNIDIRDGLQLDCVACTACIDACDEVMDKVGRERGLIRYDSQRGLREGKRRILRPRLIAYTVLLVVGAIVATTAFRGREPFEANIMRLQGMPYTHEGGVIRNSFELHIVNKQSSPATFDVEPVDDHDLSFVISMKHIEVEPLGLKRISFFVTMEQDEFHGDRPFVVRVREHVNGAPDGVSAVHDAKAVFLGARK
jgi:cytochrome c oxidase accessory protein FixG